MRKQTMDKAQRMFIFDRKGAALKKKTWSLYFPMCSEGQADIDYVCFCQMVWKKIVLLTLKLLKSKKKK